VLLYWHSKQVRHFGIEYISFVGTTDIVAMEFIPLKRINDIVAMEFIPLKRTIVSKKNSFR